MKNTIALGTLQFSGWYKKQSDKEIIELIRSFIEKGGYYIDTAPLYGFGRSDSLFQKSVTDLERKQFAVISKCGFVDLEHCNSVEEAKQFHKDISYNSIVNECEKTLNQLQINYIDIYLLHTRDNSTPLQESIQALEYLRKKKKVRFIGICNTTLEELRSIGEYATIDYIQNRFSVINRSITGEFASYLAENAIAVMPYRVIDYGLLTEKAMVSQYMPMGNLDVRQHKPDLQSDKQKIILQWAKEYLHPLAKDLGMTITQLCIAWSLNQPFNTFPVIGMTKKRQILENLASENVVLNDKTKNIIDDAYRYLEKLISNEHNSPIHVFRGLNERYY